MSKLTQRFLPIAREGSLFIWVGIGLTLLAWAAGWERIAALLALLTAFVIGFFRDPERKIAAEASVVLSPADGRVVVVEQVENPRYLEGSWQKVSIFMSVFNAHINRIPISGRVQKIRYAPGRFLVGFSEKASFENEHNAVLIADATGHQILMVQIAGLLARRIICHLSEGDTVKAGERFGMIRFGSRMDLYFSPQAEVLVVPGDRVKAGLHAIARFSRPSKPPIMIPAGKGHHEMLLA